MSFQASSEEELQELRVLSPRTTPRTAWLFLTVSSFPDFWCLATFSKAAVPILLIL